MGSPLEAGQEFHFIEQQGKVGAELEHLRSAREE
jgi:hypothetical protein